MTIFSKIKWIAGVLLIFGIILTTNLIDKSNFNQLRDSVTTIYKDRVVASDIIFEITILMQEKEMAFAISDSAFFETQNNKVNHKIQELVANYQQTNVTKKEKEIFNNLQHNLKDLEGLEKKYFNSDLKDNTAIFKTIDDIIHNLYELSKVQLEEGRKQMLLSNKAMKSINLFTQMEIILLIVIAVFIQIIIIYKSKQGEEEKEEIGT